MTPAEHLGLESRFVSSLPGDRETKNSVRQVLHACYSKVTPTRVTAPRLLAFAPEVAELLQLKDVPALTDVLAGNRVPDGAVPYAQCYAGHQFGSFAGQLGDGRAITLGERRGNDGRLYDVQLKGAGPTPYSRTADGRAVLRSSLREYLCSEAMHHLGVPTTRALSLVLTGDGVVRDMFYDGHPELEPGAIVCRVAPSFIRFGSFELHAWRKQVEELKTLADYTIRSYFPELGEPSRDVYIDWFQEVARRTAVMITEWMRVGFVHGVMNTDNMSVHGLTIDYGPYGWLDNFDPAWTPNTTDADTRRYAFGTQPNVAQWNLSRLAAALMPLIGDPDPLQAGLDFYVDTLNETQATMMAAKLGFDRLRDSDDETLVQELFALLPKAECDMTVFFRRLAGVESADLTQIADAFYSPELSKDLNDQWQSWLSRYLSRRDTDGHSPTRAAAMNAVNPKYVLRNYLAQNAIDAACEGDTVLLERLHEVLRRPYDAQPNSEEFAEKRPDWARDKPGCSALSCSS